MEYYFKPDDKLYRERYAKFLETLLLRCDDYRREDSDGAYVIALDSPWGTGKTRFVKMLRNYIEGRKPKLIGGKVDLSFIPEPDKDRAFNVVYYNAWDTDFSTDALEPLFYSLLKSPELAPDQFDAAGNDILEKFINATKEVLKAGGYALAHHLFGETVTTVIKAGIDGVNTKQQNPYEDYENRLKSIDEFRKILSEVITASKKKLVIIIDELDRCRPTFAIQTLELAKHLFAVPGLIFIFALDIAQLSHSVRTVYGADMDATGYLCRFFDYLVKMPEMNRGEFIKLLFEKNDAKGRLDSLYRKQDKTYPKHEFIDFVLSLSRKASLSLRDITTLVETFHMMQVDCQQ